MRHERLKEIRELRQLTQRDLAERTGIAPNTVYRYETGEVDPSADVLARICRELDVSADYLLGLVDKPNEHVISPEGIDPLALQLTNAVRSGDPRRIFKILQDLIVLLGNLMQLQMSYSQQLADLTLEAEIERKLAHAALDKVLDEAEARKKRGE